LVSASENPINCRARHVAGRINFFVRDGGTALNRFRGLGDAVNGSVGSPSGAVNQRTGRLADCVYRSVSTGGHLVSPGTGRRCAVGIKGKVRGRFHGGCL
jgi:hypothetical protein